MNINKKDKDMKSLVGILMILPIYMIIFVMLNVLGLNNGDNFILFPSLMYFPIIIGIILANKFYPSKDNKKFSYLIITFILIAIFFYCNTYLIEHEGWDDLGFYLLWLLNTVICKILSFVFYGKLVGWKKALYILGIYIVIVLLSIVLGFWA